MSTSSQLPYHLRYLSCSKIKRNSHCQNEISWFLDWSSGTISVEIDILTQDIFKLRLTPKRFLMVNALVFVDFQSVLKVSAQTHPEGVFHPLNQCVNFRIYMHPCITAPEAFFLVPGRTNCEGFGVDTRSHEVPGILESPDLWFSRPDPAILT